MSSSTTQNHAHHRSQDARNQQKRSQNRQGGSHSSPGLGVQSAIQGGLSTKLEALKTFLYERFVDETSVFLPQSRKADRFRCKKGIPKITFKEFIERFCLLGHIEDSVLVQSYALLKRAIKRLRLSDPSCLHKLFAMCLYLSHKMVIDYEIWLLADWGELAGLEKGQVAELEELLLIEVFRWRVFGRKDEFERVRKELVEIGEAVLESNQRSSRF